METIAHFISQLYDLKIHCSVIKGQLSCQAPKGVLTSNLREAIASRKEEIIAFFKQMEKPSLSPSLQLKRKKESNTHLPPSFAQERLWFLDQMQPGSGYYNLVTAVRLIGNLKIDALQEAIFHLSQRHEILRTILTEGVNGVQQKIKESPNVGFDYVNLKGKSKEEVTKFAQIEAIRGFDLTSGPLLRVKLFSLENKHHLLLINMHHIISDGWSLGVFVRELSILYEDYSQSLDHTPLLTELPLQYGDFAYWQREWFQSEALKNQIEYWNKQLKGHTGFLDIPTDRPRPKEQTFCGRQLPFTISSTLTQQLKQLSQKEDVTLFMTLLGALNVLLNRYTHEEDILIGSPIANRTHQELEELIGCFVNTLVIRTNLTGNPSFAELLQKIKEVTLAAYAHQDLPFEKLVEELKLQRDLGRHPLFQVVFVLQNTPMEEIHLKELQIIPVGLDLGIAKFDLTFSLMEVQGRLEGYIEYNTNLFYRETIERMKDHFCILLEGAVTHPNCSISQLPLLAEKEKQQLLVEWNTKEEYSIDHIISDLFEEQVRIFPDSIALTYQDQQMSYADLNQKANQLAHHLKKRGVKPEVLVGICLENSIEMIVSILGIFKAGGAYLPLDPNYPTDRLAFMIEDAQISILITQTQFIQKIEKELKHLLCLDQLQEILAQEKKKNLPPQAKPHHLAYVIYTSGSTGQPKGSLIPHSNIVRLFRATQPWFHFNHKDVWTLFHSCAFDFSVWEIWGALLYGGRLLIIPYWISRSPKEFYDLVSFQKVTILNQTPPAFLQFIEEEKNQTENQVLDLRLIIFGGDVLNIYRLKSWFDRHGFHVPRLVNMYGITETTVHVTYQPLEEMHLSEGLNHLIGCRIPDLQIYILDKHLNLTPIGVPGELCIGGAGLARGYLNRPELTAAKFISHPFNGNKEEKLYKSGDLGRYLPNGNIEFLGRVDSQVKVRGFRIELHEVEMALLKHEAVQEVIVLIREDISNEKQLVAYWIPKERENTVCKAAELRVFLKKSVPDYMVPAFFIKLEKFPLTNNGKLNRSVLPLPENQRNRLDQNLSFPRDIKEKLLIDVWSNVLCIKGIGIHDNFFDLGGDSILSIRVIAKSREVGIRIDLKDIFEHQTIAELASIVHFENDIRKNEQLKPFALLSKEEQYLLPKNVEDAYPLTSLQQGMLYHAEISVHAGIYHDVFSYQVRAKFNSSAMERVIKRLATYHPLLRSSFDLSSYKAPMQIVHLECPIKFYIEDIQHLSEEEQAFFIDQWIEKEKVNIFDYKVAGLLRYYIHIRSTTKFQLTLSFHHAILDGWSVASLITEFFQEYANLTTGKIYELPPKPTLSFGAFVALEQNEIHSDLSRQFWRNNLKDVRLLPLCTPLSLEKQKETHVTSHSLSISLETSQGLHGLANRLHVPLKTLLLAAHVKVISFLLGEKEIVTGLVTNGRLEQAEGDRVLGLFLNTVPLRIRIKEGSWIDLITQIFQAEKAILPHRRMPLIHIQRLIDSRSELFDTAFNFVNFHIYKNIILGDDSCPFEVIDFKGFEATNFTLNANFYVDSLSLQVYLDLKFNRSKISKQQIEKIINYYARAIESIAKHADRSLESLSLLSSEEIDQQLIAWNKVTTFFPLKGPLFTALFEEQVIRTPNVPALFFGLQTLSYQELNAVANQWAHYLVFLGVGPETKVGICLDRSPEMIIGLLAILKAGGAYVPLDPGYPQERLNWMMDDAKLEILFTQERYLDKLGSHITHRISLDRDREKARQMSITNLNFSIKPEHLAYVIYTSGSTGVPKGVMISHGGLRHYLSWCQETYGLTQGKGVPVHSSFSFDATITVLFAPLIVGSTLYLMPGRDIYVFEEPTFLAGGFSLIKMTPAHLDVLNRQLPSEKVSTLTRCLILGGETASSESLAIWKKHSPQSKIINEYGPTETVVGSSVYHIQDISQSSIPIGHPITNTQLYILDNSLQLLPVGSIGELYIGGEGVGRGYLRRPDLTAEKFIPDLYGPKTGGRLYKTGDLGRYQTDGTIEFLGRKDHQVKIRGFRIELGEIETLLHQYPFVQEAVVLLREDRPGEKRLVAYVVLTPEANMIELKTFLKKKLPEYMLPHAFISLKKMPLTGHGKIDRKGLPVPKKEGQGDLGKILPQTDLQKAIATIWKELLNINEIGIHDNFFDLGGDSLIAIHLIAKLRNFINRELPVRDLYEHPTIQELSNHITDIEQGHKEKRKWICLEEEATLEEGIGRKDQQELISEPQSVLLTGSTGFVGAFLLDELLKQTNAQIYCLIRSSHEREAMKRLCSNLRNYALNDKEVEERVIPVLGDLSRPFLGLQPKIFDRLSCELDGIYHNGAHVNFMHSYTQLQAANVNGTREILKLSSKGRIKTVHYISTLSIFSPKRNGENHSYSEDSSIEQQQHDHRFGYAGTKWISEKLIMMARLRGIPCHIYRLGTVTGHSQTGICKWDDFFHRSLIGSLQMRQFPLFRESISLDFTPVDYVSRAIVKLSLQRDLINQDYHLVNPHTLSSSDFISIAREHKLALHEIAVDKWIEQAIAFRTQTSHDVLSAIQPLLLEMKEQWEKEFASMQDLKNTLKFAKEKCTCCTTVDTLLKKNIICPKPDRELLFAYFSFFKNKGLL